MKHEISERESEFQNMNSLNDTESHGMGCPGRLAGRIGYTLLILDGVLKQRKYTAFDANKCLKQIK